MMCPLRSIFVMDFNQFAKLGLKSYSSSTLSSSGLVRSMSLLYLQRSYFFRISCKILFDRMNLAIFAHVGESFQLCLQLLCLEVHLFRQVLHARLLRASFSIHTSFLTLTPHVLFVHRRCISCPAVRCTRFASRHAAFL